MEITTLNSPARLFASYQLRYFPREFTEKVYWKAICRFWPIKLPWFVSRCIVCSYFYRNILLSLLLWYDFKILVKSRGGGTFLCLTSSVNVWQEKFFVIWKLNILSFIFLIWTEQFRIWFCRKLTKNGKIFIVF